MSNDGLTIAVVGLGFGQDFVPIYLSHPAVSRVELVEPDAARRSAVAERYGLGDGFADLSAALADPDIDAVHILTPVHLHADMVVAALEAGKHVACAVPMATSLDDIDRILAAAQESGRVYMMMETTVFSREYLAVAEWMDAGDFGAPTLYRGFHIQNLDGYPPYWQGYPPMHYATHALAPALALLDTEVISVTARGAGHLAPKNSTGGFDNPFPSESALFALRDSDVVADVTVSFFDTARRYVEGFDLFGEKLGVEWPVGNEGPLTVYEMFPPTSDQRGNRVESHPFEAPDRLDDLPEALRIFARDAEVTLPGMTAPARIVAHHGGSHPHLVHEFVMSVVQGRQPIVDAHHAAAWTAPGICAHASALAGGAPIEVPSYLGVASRRA